LVAALLLPLLSPLFFPAGRVAAQESAPPPQLSKLFEYELQVIYQINLKRRAAGVPPLRWNREMTDAARWMSWDVVENNTQGFCGHRDTLGRDPGARLRDFGYAKPYGYAENAVRAWMNSEPHRVNLLNAAWRETGVGYYRQADSSKGYVVQDFSTDPSYAPIIINNEALTTTTPAVNLYVYDIFSGAGIMGLGHSAQIMIANEPSFIGAQWQPYATEVSWNLAAGEGWRTVYVRSRDALGRTAIASDSIYLGATLPVDQLTLTQASSIQEQLTIREQGPAGFDRMQLTMGWVGDNTDPTFKLLSGSEGDSPSLPMAGAVGGSVYRMTAGDTDGYGSFYAPSFLRNVPLVAYYRLRTTDNSSTGELVRIGIDVGDETFGPLILKGTDFARVNEWQEFSLPFTFRGESGELLEFFIYRSGEAQMEYDAAGIYTAPFAYTPPLQWDVPSGHFRGKGIWARFVDPAGRTTESVEILSHWGGMGSTPAIIPGVPVEPGTPVEPVVPPVVPAAPSLATTLNKLEFATVEAAQAPPPQSLTIACNNCTDAEWSFRSSESWLVANRSGNVLSVQPLTAALPMGLYQAVITIDETPDIGATPLIIQVIVTVGEADEVAQALPFKIFMPSAKN
jgi:hypothetical protein